MVTVDNPRAVQENSFPGVSGVESLDLGQRGRFTEVSGLLVGTTAGDLQSALILFRSYDDGFAYVLVDNFGGAWPYVRLENFQPQPRTLQGADGMFYQKYTARFRHLL